MKTKENLRLSSQMVHQTKTCQDQLKLMVQHTMTQQDQKRRETEQQMLMTKLYCRRAADRDGLHFLCLWITWLHMVSVQIQVLQLKMTLHSHQRIHLCQEEVHHVLVQVLPTQL